MDRNHMSGAEMLSYLPQLGLVAQPQSLLTHLLDRRRRGEGGGGSLFYECLVSLKLHTAQ